MSIESSPRETLRENLFEGLWFCFWLGLSASWILTAAATLGATFDEPIDLHRAMDFWRRGSHHELMRVGSMPLPMDVASFPAYLYERWTGTQIEWNAAYPTEVLFWCRAIMLVFWVMLLAFARIVGRSLGGPWGGRLAVAFLACEPNFLAHAALATKDITISAFLVATLYFFSKGREASWARRILVPGLWVGGCLLAKASAMVFVPVGLLMIEIHRLAQAGAFAASEEPAQPILKNLWNRFVTPLRPSIKDMTRIGFIGLVVAFIYCGSDWQPEHRWVEWSRNLPESPFKSVMVFLSQNLAIFNNAGVGLVRQIGHNLRGHGAYLLGESTPKYWWYYFPVAISIKMTLPILLLPLFIVAIQRRSLSNWACLMAGVLFLYSLRCHVQIGIRLMMPWIAVGIIGLSAASARAWVEVAGLWKRQIIVGYCTLGLVWNAYGALAIWPHGLCYVNELWGGSREGYRLISDSNYDWGQGVPELERWLAQHDSPPLSVLYFGTDPNLKKLPTHKTIVTDISVEKLLKDVEGSYLAVGTTFAYGSYLPPHDEVNKLLRRMNPVGRTQTFLIYDFTHDTPLAARAER